VPWLKDYTTGLWLPERLRDLFPALTLLLATVGFFWAEHVARVRSSTSASAPADWTPHDVARNSVLWVAGGLLFLFAHCFLDYRCLIEIDARRVTPDSVLAAQVDVEQAPRQPERAREAWKVTRLLVLPESVFEQTERERVFLRVPSLSVWDWIRRDPERYVGIVHTEARGQLLFLQLLFLGAYLGTFACFAVSMALAKEVPGDSWLSKLLSIASDLSERRERAPPRG
jgi:hypothetical protein